MPRAKVDPANRKRVARACDLCRKRKEKCAGGDPCPQCRERGAEDLCKYTPVQKTPYSSPAPGHTPIVNSAEPAMQSASPPAFKQRQRVVIACDACRKRKERCDGQKPACGACNVRGMEAACNYTPITPSQAQRANRPNANVLLRGRDSVAPGSGSHGNDRDVTEHYASEAHLTPQASVGPSGRSTSANGTSQGFRSVDQSLLSAPLPKLSRMLKDGKGGFVYVGDSSTASFLQSVRRHVATSLGPVTFTTEDGRHTMPEATPPEPNYSDEPLPSSSVALNIAEHYGVSVSGLLDLFDQSWLTDLLPSWINEPTLERHGHPHSPIVYLALAIGFQDRNNTGDDNAAEVCFAKGRTLATTRLMDAPSLLTVQAFALITYYMLAAYRRNAAFVNLGVAVRAAYVLGIHRHEANAASEDGLSRERIWKSLRALDLFISASTGRPPATFEPDCNVSWASLEFNLNGENSTVPAQASSAIFRICDIIERILTEVYSKRSVSLELAGSISAKHREWTTNLAKMLEIDALSDKKVGSSVVTMAYYYSIILLARPFLEYRVSSPQNAVTKPNTIVQSANIETYADACVDSAIKTILLANEAEFPQRQPMIINCVFISALCIGLAYFGDYDQRGWPLGRHLDSAITLLQRLGHANPQAARYKEICLLLEEATRQYAKNRDENWLQSSSRHVRNVFGDLQTTETPQPGSSQHQTPYQAPDHSSSLAQLVDAAASTPSAQFSQTPSRAPAAYMTGASGENSDAMDGVVHNSGVPGPNSYVHPRSATNTDLSAANKATASYSFGD